MADMQNSSLLDKILAQAQKLAEENTCSGLTRDYIYVAASRIANSRESAPDEESQAELNRLAELLAKTNCPAEPLLDAWRGKQVPLGERTILMLQKNKAANAQRSKGSQVLTADALLEFILAEKTSAMQAAMAGTKPLPPQPEPARDEAPAEPQTASVQEEAAVPPAAPEKLGIGELTEHAKELQAALQARVLGQSHAVSTFAAGYFQAELQMMIEQNRTRPLATFLFAGPPGVGKTFLSEESARVLKLPFRRFDMSEYAGPAAVDELSGSDANYKASSEGLLTGFVKRNPRCLLLFDEIEKASLDVIHLFLQILDAGRLRDNRTDEEVPFQDAVLIFTTNAGKNLYQDNPSANLSSLSREVILDALAHDINPKTREPFFPAAICSRFASGNVVMFNHLEAHSLCRIVEKRLTEHFADLSGAMGIETTMDAAIPCAILLAEGASADARTVKSRADSFFSGELYELFRMATSSRFRFDLRTLKRIHFSLDLSGSAPDTSALFVPSTPVHALVYSKTPLPVDPSQEGLPILHYVDSLEQAKQESRSYDAHLLFCDLLSDAGDGGQPYLNREDLASPARSFLYDMLQQFPEMPVLLIEPKGSSYTDEERDSYIKRGVRGFLTCGESEEELYRALRETVDSTFQHNSLSELARSNKLVTYETAQRISPDGQSAEIILFDLKLKTAVKADDSGNILSMLSRPDVRFDDVIGADDAKSELQFFTSFIKQPGMYIRKGAAAPKGILLYGPPGTGKTMLAKAFAAESNATFIAAEGNQFFKGIVGQGAAMVHRLFAAARRYAPSVLFVDEIDAIARARTGRDTDMAQDSEQILTAFFAEMDGFATNPSKPVFVLGATNYGVEGSGPMTLDPAMLRRFDRKILVDLPSAESRRLFLTKQLKKRGMDHISENEIASLSDRSAGMSLAQLSSVLDLAVRSLLRQDQDYVDDAALEEAFETYNSGEKRKWDPEVTLRTARHESGHALISWLGGDPPSYLTIVSRGNYGGYMQHGSQEGRMGYTRRELLSRIRTALGGRAAELVYYGPEEGISTGASGDLRTATELARSMLCTYGMDDDFGMAVLPPSGDSSLHPEIQAAVNRILRDQLDEAVQLISVRRSAMDKLVDALLQASSLRKDDIDKVLRDVVE